jgi:hypothetical protein
MSKGCIPGSRWSSPPRPTCPAGFQRGRLAGPWTAGSAVGPCGCSLIREAGCRLLGPVKPRPRSDPLRGRPIPTRSRTLRDSSPHAAEAGLAHFRFTRGPTGRLRDGEHGARGAAPQLFILTSLPLRHLPRCRAPSPRCRIASTRGTDSSATRDAERAVWPSCRWRLGPK